MSYALAILLVAVLSILAFVLGSYLLIRVGRMVTQQRVGGKATDYSDAWSKYRLTEQDIDAATAEHDADSAADDSSRDKDRTEGPDEESDDSESRE